MVCVVYGGVWCAWCMCGVRGVRHDVKRRWCGNSPVGPLPQSAAVAAPVRKGPKPLDRLQEELTLPTLAAVALKDQVAGFRRPLAECLRRQRPLTAAKLSARCSDDWRCGLLPSLQLVGELIRRCTGSCTACRTSARPTPTISSLICGICSTKIPSLALALGSPLAYSRRSRLQPIWRLYWPPRCAGKGTVGASSRLRRGIRRL